MFANNGLDKDARKKRPRTCHPGRLPSAFVLALRASPSSGSVGSRPREQARVYVSR